MSSETGRLIVVEADLQALAEAAASRLLARIRDANGPAAICLTGGSTSRPLYERLALEPCRSALPWDRVHWFWGDDRFVPTGDPRSNAGTARRIFFDRIPVPPDHIHQIPTPADAESPHAAARLYEAELKRFYGVSRLNPARPLFDIVLMGLGADGHTASLFPHSPALEETEHWVVGVEQAEHEPFVPRVTLTLPTLASTREMLFLVSGSEKRDALARVLAGDDLPATRARSNGAMVWLVDRDAVATEAVRSESGDDPSVIVVMGVSGAGKTAIGAMLAHRLGWIYEDGDWFHPRSNIEKMERGIPLTDADRSPWLNAIAAWIDETRRVGRHGVLSCSALKRAYRDIMIGERRDIRLVYLKGDKELIARRLAARFGHFMPPTLLDNQFATLEEPQADERPIVVSIEPHPRDIVETIVAELGIKALGASALPRTGVQSI